MIAEGGFVGNAWFDDFEFEELPRKPVAAVFSDRYRDSACDGEVTMSVALNGRDVQGGLDGAVAWFEFVGTDGRPWRGQAVLSGEVARLTFPVGSVALGPSPVKFRIRAKSGEEIAETLVFTHQAESVKPPVGFSGRRASVGGKKFFPLGMYWLRFSEGNLDEYAKGPFNCLLPYETPTEGQLDRCAEKGLKCIVNLCRYRFRGHFKTDAEEKAWVDGVMSYAKNHSATLAYYLNDEIPLSRLSELTERYRFCRANDPGHPAFSVVCEPADVREYLPTFDVIGSDPYPIPGRPLGSPTEWMRKIESATCRMRPIWQVVQVFDYGAYKHNREEALAVPTPTVDEMRNMIWQALANGADGLIFYSYFDLLKMDWKRPFSETWADVCRLGREVREYEDVFLSDEAAPSVHPIGTVPDEISYRAWSRLEAVYLAVVNPTLTPVRCRFSMRSVLKTSSVLVGRGTVMLEGDGVIVADLPPQGVAFARMLR